MFFVVSGKNEPVVLIDEEGSPAAYRSKEEAEAAAAASFMGQSFDYVIVECDGRISVA